MDDNCGEWVECIGVTCVASGSGWNLWVWLLGVVVRRYIPYSAEAQNFRGSRNLKCFTETIFADQGNLLSTPFTVSLIGGT